MLVSINSNHSYRINKPVFKGSWALTEQGNPYYKTKAGTVMGSIGATGAVLDGVVGIKETKGLSIIAGLVSAGISLAIGTQIDKSRNKKTAQAVDYIKQVGVKNAVMSRDDLEVSNKNKVFYKSKEGRKIYTTAGMVIGGLTTLPIIFAPKVPSIAKISLPLAGIAVGAFGGWLDGLIVDYFSNRTAKKYSNDILNISQEDNIK